MRTGSTQLTSHCSCCCVIVGLCHCGGTSWWWGWWCGGGQMPGWAVGVVFCIFFLELTAFSMGEATLVPLTTVRYAVGVAPRVPWRPLPRAWAVARVCPARQWLGMLTSDGCHAVTRGRSTTTGE